MRACNFCVSASHQFTSSVTKSSAIKAASPIQMDFQDDLQTPGRKCSERAVRQVRAVCAMWQNTQQEEGMRERLPAQRGAWPEAFGLKQAAQVGLCQAQCF